MRVDVSDPRAIQRFLLDQPQDLRIPGQCRLRESLYQPDDLVTVAQVAPVAQCQFSGDRRRPAGAETILKLLHLSCYADNAIPHAA